MSEPRENVQLVQRRANLAAVVELGVPAYPHRFDCTDTPSAIVAAHGATSGADLDTAQITTATAGRILIVRSFGKARFFVISDGVSRLQVYVRKDALSARDFKIAALLDIGDLIGVDGRLFRTRTDELTVWAARIKLLAKCFVPLPEKWHGLKDVETRYRQRYVDLIVNPAARRVFEVRARVLTTIRAFLRDRGYLEVETPMMQAVPGGCAGAALRHPSQRAGPAALSAGRARAVSQAAGRGRNRSGLRAQPKLQERGDFDSAQSRVHDAGVLSGLQRLSRPDDHDRASAGDDCA